MTTDINGLSQVKSHLQGANGINTLHSQSSVTTRRRPSSSTSPVPPAMPVDTGSMTNVSTKYPIDCSKSYGRSLSDVTIENVRTLADLTDESSYAQPNSVISQNQSISPALNSEVSCTHVTEVAGVRDGLLDPVRTLAIDKSGISSDSCDYGTTPPTKISQPACFPNPPETSVTPHETVQSNLQMLSHLHGNIQSQCINDRPSFTPSTTSSQEIGRAHV